jgi:AcrR family transcriptional regulator
VVNVVEQAKAAPNGSAERPPPARSLWFEPPMGDRDRRAPLTRERVVTEALALIGGDGVDALTMRTLATRLGVVPGALYRHVRNKEQLHDLVLDAVLAEVDTTPEASAGWAEQLRQLANRVREVLERHPGLAGLLQLRDPLGPHSLALAEAFLVPLRAAGFGADDIGPAFFLLIDYTTGFAASSPAISTNEQRVRDRHTRAQLHGFFRALPADSFPTLVSLGEHVWVDNRDQRFSTGLRVILSGLEEVRPK